MNPVAGVARLQTGSSKSPSSRIPSPLPSCTASIARRPSPLSSVWADAVDDHAAEETRRARINPCTGRTRALVDLVVSDNAMEYGFAAWRRKRPMQRVTS